MSPKQTPNRDPDAKRALICGGAGYIGSHMCKLLARSGWLPVVFDNLSTGHREAVRWGPLIEGDLLDAGALRAAFARYEPIAVLHFAALSQVAESMQYPERYRRNNVDGTANLLMEMERANVRRLVFSSTAAVYGAPDRLPIDEDCPCHPINPYGASKLAAEELIRAAAARGQVHAVCLRYFNAIGADPDGETGECHRPETHLVPNLIHAALNDGVPAVVHGDDYDTADGTCVRDYVDVMDLCEAHLAALHALEANGGCQALNLGSGVGCSVLEVLAAVQRACNGLPRYRVAGRRPGDPPVLVAGIREATTVLGWSPRTTLDASVRNALAWHSRRKG